MSHSLHKFLHQALCDNMIGEKSSDVPGATRTLSHFHGLQHAWFGIRFVTSG